MEASPFTALPHDILIDLLFLVPTSSIISLYAVNSAHLNVFDAEHGLWEQLARRIFHWSASTLPNFKAWNTIDWKKEFRVASYFQSALQNGRMHVYSSSPQTVEFITDHHIKFEELTKYLEFCCLQHDTKLYPLPIGNFTTAYYEVEILSEITPITNPLVVGGALSGFTGFVGASILSYGYASQGGIYLECDATTIEDSEFIIQQGDIMGFGINFAKQSVFFTKNGKLIHEATKNVHGDSLLELKNLHATITLGQNEILVNRGSNPFIFDILKYQHQHANKPLELYSNIAMRHLVSQYELTGSIIEKRYMSGKFRFFSDYSVPNFPVKLPDVFYFLLYRRQPGSNLQEFPEEGDFLAFEISRIMMDCYQVIFDMGNKQTDNAKCLLDVCIKYFGLDHLKDQLKEMLGPMLEVQFQEITALLLKPYADEVATHLFQYESSLAHYFNTLLAAVEYFCADRPEVEEDALYWSKEIALTALKNEDEDLDDLESNLIGTLYYIRVNIALKSVLAQRCGDFARKKVEEYEHMKFVFGVQDKSLKGAYITLLANLNKRVSENQFNYMKKPKGISAVTLMNIHCMAIMFINKQDDEMVPVHELLFYGIYELKLSPNDFASAEEFVLEVLKLNEKRSNDQVKHEFLEFIFQSAALFEDKENLIKLEKPLRHLFGVKIKFQEGNSIEEIRQKISQKVSHMLETKNYGKIAHVQYSKSIKRELSTSNTSLIVIGAVVAVSVIGAILLRKQISK